MILLAAAVVISLSPWPDPFDAGFQARVAGRAVHGEEIAFTPAPARAWVDAVRSMPEHTPAKQQYVQFLKDTYGYNIGAYNAAYGLDAGSFTELLTYDYRRLDRRRDAVVRDDGEFLKLLAGAARDAARQNPR